MRVHRRLPATKSLRTYSYLPHGLQGRGRAAEALELVAEAAQQAHPPLLLPRPGQPRRRYPPPRRRRRGGGRGRGGSRLFRGFQLSQQRRQRLNGRPGARCRLKRQRRRRARRRQPAVQWRVPSNVAGCRRTQRKRRRDVHRTAVHGRQRRIHREARGRRHEPIFLAQRGRVRAWRRGEDDDEGGGCGGVQGQLRAVRPQVGLVQHRHGVPPAVGRCHRSQTVVRTRRVRHGQRRQLAREVRGAADT